MLGRAIALLLVIPAPLCAWSKQSQVDIAWEAARLAPPDLYRQIVKHQNAFRDGVVEPYSDATRSRHEKNADGSGFLDRVIVEEAERAVSSLTSHRPLQDAVRQLGLLLHSVIEANNPLLTSSADADEASYAEDFGRYLDSTTDRLPVVFYGVDFRLKGPADLPAFVARSIDRSRLLYPHIATEYKRVGGASGLKAFDDRSTAFGVAAVSFNRAVTDAAVVLRYVWLEAGGADFLPRRSLESGTLLKVHRSN